MYQDKTCKNIQESHLKQGYGKINAAANKKGNLLIHLVWCIATLIFTCFALYWIIEVIKKYQSEPVMSTITLSNKKVFDWPAITVCPAESCYNDDARKELGLEYNLTVGEDLSWLESVTRNDFSSFISPFNINESNFDWEQYNYSY